ncbi:MAG: 16S rRNA (uracil(1498)-N(3))-methyltransferase [Hahellaceae bacterium]|nr:16S rRNA (uracil(1498)-N(3))-methyltransferase [Hahellaceae bacterium]MCP5168625.1 16S rRNA (uracil(1498)-N(3))-methyltransferase [Hahellaceae bacterium]
MNIALLSDDDFISPDRAQLTGRRLQHLLEVHKAQAGDRLKVGKINGLMGTAELTELTSERCELQVNLHTPPPPPLPVILIIALPRPKMLRRIIQTAATMGVKQLYFINAYKVEKSYWQSPWLDDESLRENLLLGLEQGVDTQLPEIHLRKRFKPFVEDELPQISAGTHKLVAHPGSADSCPAQISHQVTLVIGPEGGFTPYEVGKLQALDFAAVHLGPRILRVETAVPVLLARLFDSSVFI